MRYKLRLRDKLSLGFLSITIFSLILSLISSVTLYNSRVNDEVTPRLTDSTRAIKATLTGIQDKSIIYTNFLGDLPEIVRFLEEKSPPEAVVGELIKIGGKTDLDILQITDGDGRVLGRMENTSFYDDNKGNDLLVKSAINGQKSSTIYDIDKKLSVVAVSPIKSGGKVIGTLTAGYYLNNRFLLNIQSSLNEEIIVYHNNTLSATTIPNLKLGTLTDEELTKNLGKISPENPIAIGIMDLDGKRYMASITSLTSLSKEIGYLVSATSLEPIILANTNTLYSLFIIFVFTIILALSLSIYLSEQIVKPIKIIQKGADIIGSGNLSYKLDIQSGDEVEKVAESFNSMAKKLEEAFQSTQEKVRQLEGQKNRLDLSARLLLRRDLDLREINEELEREKWSITAEKNKLGLILSGIADGVIALDLERKIIIFSQGTEKLTGIRAKDVLGKHIDKVIKIFRPLDQQVDVSEFCPIKNGGLASDEVLFQEQHLSIKVSTNNKEFYANVMSATIKESKIISLGCILTFHDVTYEHELEQMKVDFVSMAAHELRTPLTSITGYLYFLQEELTPTLTPEQKTYLERVVISSKQLQTLIDNLLDVSKIEKGSLTLEIKKECWEDLLTEVVTNFKDYAAQKEIKLALNLPKQKLPYVLVDKFRISEVLANLLSNAVNFTSRGGKVSIKAGYKKGEVITEIEDTGTGIPEEALPKLFTKFYRVSGILSEGSKGTGLGLFISKAVVELHKGKIWVKSEFGKGSTFSFSLPI